MVPSGDRTVLLPVALLLAAAPLAVAQGLPGGESAVYFAVSNNMDVGVTTREDRPLTYSVDGSTGYTFLRIDGKSIRVRAPIEVIAPSAGKSTPPTKFVTYHKSIFRHANQIALTQEVAIVDGKRPAADGGPLRSRNTCRIRWTIENTDTVPHEIGLLTIIDTMIGLNDGNPFVVPGKAGLVSIGLDFRQAREVPTYVKAIEKPSVTEPGLTSYFTLKFDGKWSGPDRVCLTGRPVPMVDTATGRPQPEIWDFAPRELGNDSAVALYWSPQKLEPEGNRKLSYAYGLGIASSD
jgi:hypothetical protein